MITKKEAKIIAKKMQPKPSPPPPKYEGKGTRARLNTAAEKMVFNTKYS